MKYIKSLIYILLELVFLWNCWILFTVYTSQLSPELPWYEPCGMQFAGMIFSCIPLMFILGILFLFLDRFIKFSRTLILLPFIVGITPILLSPVHIFISSTTGDLICGITCILAGIISVVCVIRDLLKNENILMHKYVLIPVLLILIILLWPSYSTTIFVCQNCGSQNRIHKIRIPGFRELPAIYEASYGKIEESSFYDDFHKYTGVHEWEFASETISHPIAGLWADGPGHYLNSIIISYNYFPKFREYIQQNIKDGKYTKRQIIELAKPENKEKAQELIDEFHSEK